MDSATRQIVLVPGDQRHDQERGTRLRPAPGRRVSPPPPLPPSPRRWDLCERRGASSSWRVGSRRIGLFPLTPTRGYTTKESGPCDSRNKRRGRGGPPRTRHPEPHGAPRRDQCAERRHPRELDRRLDRESLLPLAVLAVGLCLVAGTASAQPPASGEAAYRAFPYVGSRLAVWVVAQIHLCFAAFILGVPIFAVIIEVLGWRAGLDRPEGRRFDWLAHEFVKLTFAAFSTTALLGGLLLFLLITLYPRFWTYMSQNLRPDDVALRPPLLPRDLHRLPLVLRLGLAVGRPEVDPRHDRRGVEPPGDTPSCSSRTRG